MAMTPPLEDFIMSLSTELLGVDPDDLSSTLLDALRRLSEVLEVDRAYVYKTASDRSPGEVFQEWWAPGVEQRNTPIAELPIEAQRFWVRSLRSGEVVHADDLEELEAQCPEAAGPLRGDGVRSILFVPLVARDVPAGFVGFEARRRNVTWSPVTISRMRTVGELLVSAVDRSQTDAERAKAARDLAHRNAELERSNRELQQFASIVSHDLKQPLVVAQGFLELLSGVALEHPTRSAEAATYADAARRGTTRMRMLIDDVLALARAGTGLGRPEPVDLATVGTEVLADLEAEIASTRADVTIGALPTIDGSSTQLRQLLQNLVANALKFHGPDVAPVVRITSVDDGRRCTISVEDNGIGIAPDRRSSVFEMFARADNDAALGLGIGLAVCARVVDNHHGKIWIEDADLGGTAVRVQLPLRQKQPS
jgi:signal transduction histidine kinase